jgi:hypothetical protein
MIGFPFFCNKENSEKNQQIQGSINAFVFGLVTSEEARDNSAVLYYKLCKESRVANIVKNHPGYGFVDDFLYLRDVSGVRYLFQSSDEKLEFFRGIGLSELIQFRNPLQTDYLFVLQNALRCIIPRMKLPKDITVITHPHLPKVGEDKQVVNIQHVKEISAISRNQFKRWLAFNSVESSEAGF